MPNTLMYALSVEPSSVGTLDVGLDRAPLGPEIPIVTIPPFYIWSPERTSLCEHLLHHLKSFLTACLDASSGTTSFAGAKTDLRRLQRLGVFRLR